MPSIYKLISLLCFMELSKSLMYITNKFGLITVLMVVEIRWIFINILFFSFTFQFPVLEKIPD